MNKEQRNNLSFYLSYLPLAGSIVALLMSLIFYFVNEKAFTLENLVRPILYFLVFSALGLGIGKKLNGDFKVAAKKLTVIFIIIFIIINIGRNFNFF